MAHTPRVGDVVAVTARRSDGNSRYDVGTVRIEDLDCILSRVQDRTGPRGPNGEMTQWILQQAALHLSQELSSAFGVGRPDAPLTQVLSSLVGHEPFATGVLGLSAHQITRRWPTASDWYSDLLAYVLRPARVTQHADRMARYLVGLGGLPFGQLARMIGREVIDAAADPTLYSLADLLETLWPDHPLVVDATLRARHLMEQSWAAIYQGVFETYALAIRGDLRMLDVVWTCQALTAWEIRELRVTPGPREFWDGEEWARSSREALVFLAGALVTEDGRSLTPEELRRRPPVR